MNFILNKCIEIVKKQPLPFALSIIICVSLSITYIYETPAPYKSDVKIEHHEELSGQLPVFDNSTPATEEIKSVSFLKSAIGDKQLINYFVENDFQKRESQLYFPYTINYVLHSKNFSSQSYQVTELTNENYTLSTEISGIKRFKSGIFGTPLTDNNVTITISKKKIAAPVEKAITGKINYLFTIYNPEYYAALLSSSSQLKVKSKNNVVTISCENLSPQLATSTTTAIANHFITSKESNGTTSNDITELDKKIEQSGIELEETENQIAAYKKENQITDLNYDTENILSRLKDLQQQKTQLELRMSALNTLSNYLRKNRDGNNSNVEYGTISDPVFSEQIARLNEKYEARNSNNTASTDGEIENLKTLISERILNTRKQNAVQLEELRKEIATLKYQASLIPDQATTLQILDRKYTLGKKVYDLLVEKRAIALVSGNTQRASSKIIQPANVKSTVASFTLIILSIGLFGGIISGLFFSGLSMIFSSLRVSKKDDIITSSSIPCIGNINHKRKGQIRDNSIDTLCTKVLLKNDVKLISVASTTFGEGKTFITVNLARTFAAIDKRTLIIEMSGNDVADEFGVTPENNLSQVLLGKCDINETICITSIPNIDILQFGEIDGGINSFLASKKKEAIIKELRKHYDVIITDTPAINGNIDAIPIMKISDLNLVVARAKSTRTGRIAFVENLKKEYDIENMNFILNSTAVQNVKINSMKIKPSATVRSINSSKQETVEVPGFLRKIALWFY
jgi:capsular exopolysaccharide synthesis family protein